MRLRPFAFLKVIAVLAIALLASCIGTSSGESVGSQHNVPAPPDPGSKPSVSACLAASPVVTVAVEPQHLPQESACGQGCDVPAPRQLRRLTVSELNSTLRDLFNDPSVPQATNLFANDGEVYTFRNVAAHLQIDELGALQLRTLAETVGSYAGARAAALSPTCQDTSPKCETLFITSFGARALRAPLDAFTASDYLALMQQAPTFATGVDTVVTAMLMSPLFIFRQELGQVSSDGTFALTPYEVASEVSYMILGSMPDEALFAAAADGSLLDPKVRLSHARRLMEKPAAHVAIDQFFLQWLGVNDLAKTVRSQGSTTLDANTVARMVTEATLTIDNVVWATHGTFVDLHSTKYSFMDDQLAAFYGGIQSAGATMAQVSLTGARDPGVLNLGAVLSAASQVNVPSPVLRGRMLREHILCQTLPPPPPNVSATVTSGNDAGSSTTTRDLYAAHVTTSTCASCHDLMDPMAFAQGDYDTLGRRFPQNMENGKAIDTAGTINGLLGSDPVAIADAGALSAFVAASPQAQACLARNWAMYGFGSVSWLQDGCTFDSLNAVARTSGYNLQETLAAITQVSSFTRRIQDH